MLAVRVNEDALGIVTRPVVPLNTSAPPKRPEAVRVTPVVNVPELLMSDASVTVVPLASLNPYAATRPGTCARMGIAQTIRRASDVTATEVVWVNVVRARIERTV